LRRSANSVLGDVARYVRPKVADAGSRSVTAKLISVSNTGIASSSKRRTMLG
jgi:hypothetical protein